MTNDPLILKLLLLGEGDCSGALAMLRAYHHHHHGDPHHHHESVRIALVITTPLHSASELDATYPETALYNIQQMEQILMTTTRSSRPPNSPPPIDSVVLYNIDACHLDTPEVQERLRQQLQWWLSWLQSSDNNNDKHDDDNNDGMINEPKNDENENDPTQQSSQSSTPLFDMVLFQYPHLGIPVPTASTKSCSMDDHNNDEDEDESILRQRHVSLLHHYLYSASFVAPIVHVTLNVAQYQSWLVPARSSVPTATTTNTTTSTTSTTAATETPLPIWSFPDRLLQLQKVVPVQQPFHGIFPAPFHETMTSADASTTTTRATVRRVSKKYHGGNHRHYLSKFGYHHVRTITSSTKKLGPVSLVGSCHYILKCHPRVPIATDDTKEMVITDNNAPHPNDVMSCSICGVSCSNVLEYERHVENPTRFPIAGCCVNSIHRHDTTSTHGITMDFDNPTDRTKTSTNIDGNVDNNPAGITAVGGRGTASSRTPMKRPTFHQGHSPKVMESIISNEDIGRRLRWFLQHAMHESDDGVHLSKRQSERLIHNGCVYIQNEVVTDSSRILHTVGQVIRVHLPPDNILGTTSSSQLTNEDVDCDPQHETTTATVDETCDANGKVVIIDTHPIHQLPSNHGSFLIVVWKPVGMRTIGSFTNDTLEQYLFHHHQPPISTSDVDANSTRNGQGPIISRYRFKSLSKLDKGCGGLCVVVMQQQSPESSASTPIQELTFRIQHTYTALVYGNNFPPEWKTGASILLPVYGLRRWKNRKRQAPMATRTNGKSSDCGRCNGSINNLVDDVDDKSCSSNDDDIEEIDATLSHANNYSNEMEATITVMEQTQTVGESNTSDHIPPLSTISIATTSTVSGLAQTIAYYLRRHSCSIVGDRMAIQEYNTLPRAVRNRIKQRLCLGCTGVRVEMPLQRNDDTSSSQLHVKMFESKHLIPVKWSALHWQEFCSKSSKQDG